MYRAAAGHDAVACLCRTGEEGAMGEVAVIAALPGRVRLSVRRLYQEAELAYGIEQAVAALRGVRLVHANPASGRVLVEFDPLETTLDRIVNAVAGARPLARPPARQTGQGEQGFIGEVLRLALSGIVLAGLVVGRITASAP